MSDLLVTTHTPVLRSGQTMRTYGVARALAEPGEGLDLLYARFEGDEPDEAFRAIAGIEFHEIAASRGARRLAAYLRARAAGTPQGFARGISPELAAAAERLAASPGRGRVIADGPIAAAALRGLARRRPVIYNAHNLESGFRGELSGGEPSVRRLRAFERGLLRGAAESWMVSEAELEAAAALCPGAHLRYVPNVVDVAAIEPVAPAAEPRAVFVANFAYEPNRNGLRFLLESVMPQVWERLPAARLRLVGAGLELAPGTDERVEAAGFLDRVADGYEGARCAVVPLLQGGGTPLKFVEALAYGLPVLATPRAAAGLGVSDGRDCVLAEGAQDFAAALGRLLEHGDPAMGARGRELAAERYSVQALARLLAA